jgi:hypothetical protein
MCIQCVLLLPIALASYKHIDLQWTPATLIVVKTSSTLNFNLQLVSPDCSLPLSFSMKWFWQQSVPFVFMAIYIVLYVPYYIWIQRKSWESLVPRMKGMFLNILNFCYFSVASSTLSVFDCRLNGVQFSLSSEPSIMCSMDDKEYRTVFVPAIVCLCIYVVGIPLLISVLLFKNRRLITEDQMLYLASMQEEHESVSKKSPVYVKGEVFTQYGFLYRQYKPDKVRVVSKVQQSIFTLLTIHPLLTFFSASITGDLLFC